MNGNLKTAKVALSPRDSVESIEALHLNQQFTIPTHLDEFETETDRAMSINQVQNFRTMGTNEALVAVVDGIELEIMQEMATLLRQDLLSKQMSMAFCWYGEKWCAITGWRAEDGESCYKRATQESEYDARHIPCHWIICN